MAHFSDDRAELIHLLELALRGDSERLRIRATRLIRSMRAANDDLAGPLKNAVFAVGHESASLVRAIRRAPSEAAEQEVALAEPLPLDQDSGLELLRLEDSRESFVAPLLGHATELAVGQIIKEHQSIGLLARAALHPTRTALFTGPPGVGKTISARHIAQALCRPLLVLDLATVVSSFLGRTGNNLKQAFEYARRQPCVLLLDEIDAIAKRRDDNSDVGELKRLVTVVLQEIDRWPAGMLLVAATNHPDLLDPAVWRRFEIRVDFDRPSYQQLEALASLAESKNDLIPQSWIRCIALALARTSHADFVRATQNIRRAIALNGIAGARDVLRNVVGTRCNQLTLDEKKMLAAGLVAEAGLSQREAARLVGIARNTVSNSVSPPEAENG